ncbi:MAG: TonB-dependent receptor [Tannerella sp.]|nr:TonB-dependent receptor [Tannerella sp.]
MVNTAFAQTKSVTGTVVDSEGEAVIGASVTVVGTVNGVITDIDGNFSLTNVAANAKLKISYVGYVTQEIAVDGKSVIRVTLKEDVQLLDEVQVVAYGVQKKVTVTGAISGVKGDELLRSPVGSVSNVLSGLMTGITSIQYSGEPGSDAASIFVRGKATFQNANPLIQVDGVERGFNDIDPNEIESITVLKDASATAVFGVRGANGVVLITTKRGKEGQAKISFSTSGSVLMPTKLVEKASSLEYAEFHNLINRLDGTPETFTAKVIDKFRTGSDPIRYPSTDWIDYVLKDATLQTQHNINISGGTDRVRYFVSAGAYTQGGLFKDFNLPYDLSYQYNRFNYRSNLDIDVTKSTTISINIGGNVDNSNKPYTGQGSSGMVRSLYWSTPFSGPGIIDGKLITAANNYVVSDPDENMPFVGANGIGTYYGNGFMATSNNKLNVDLILNQKLDFITKGLSFRVKGAYNSSFYIYKDASAATARYTPVLMDDGTMAYKKAGENNQTTYTERRGKDRNWYMEAAFDYNRSFGDHTVSALVLYNQEKKYYPTPYPDIPRGMVGLVGRVTYNWKNRYMAEFNMGYNGSENFHEDRRFGFFPAGSVGWAVSEESFWKSIRPVINFMKLRASLGLVGNDIPDSGRFLYTADPYLVDLDQLFNRGNNAGNNGIAYYFGTNRNVLLGAKEAGKNNAEVTWEKALKQNYGADLSILNERLKASVDYFREERTDILLSDATAPAIIGFSVPQANLGEVKSWGWELSLRWDDRIGKNFRYYFGINLSNNQNEIIEKKETPQNYDWLYQKGHRIGARSLYKFWRFYDESTPELYEKTFGIALPDHGVALRPGDAVFVDLNGDGVINTEDASYDYGYTDDPQYLAGVNMGFSWKNFDVSLQWTGAWEVSRQISDVFARPFVSNDSQTQGGLLKYHVYNTWTEDNPSQAAKYPRPTWTHATNNYRGSTLFEADASYLRLKSLQIAYNFNFPFMKKIKLNACQLALSGYNLLTFTDYMWGDPESRASNAPTYPLQKTYSLSLKLGF